MLKELALSVLQRLFGLEEFLYLFARYKIGSLGQGGEGREFLAFVESLPRDGLVLDVGANLGVMTVHLSRHLARGRVLAFEPMPENRTVLLRLVRRFGLANVQVEACALGERDGTVEMVMPVEWGARRHGLSHVVHETIAARNSGPRRDVPMRRLDGFELPGSAGEARLTAIKMDVENFEWFVLKGALATLEAHRPVLYVELWANENRERCFELLGGLGYRAFVRDEGREAPYEAGRHAQQNFIFRPGPRPG